MIYTNSILKTIGFFSNPYKNEDFIANGFNKIDINDETINFLNKSYHSEYINLMFNNSPNEFGVTKLEKKIDVEIEIINPKNKVKVNSITLFNFFDSFKKDQFSIFSVDYKVLSSNLDDLSDSILSLKNPDSLIKLSSKEISLNTFLQQSIMKENFIDENSAVSQYAGYKYKHYLVSDFEKEEFKQWARKNIILVELDFPKRTPISEELRKQNDELRQMFGVRGYPTGWFITPEKGDGKVNFKQLGSQGYVRGGVDPWITGANQILKIK